MSYRPSLFENFWQAHEEENENKESDNELENQEPVYDQVRITRRNEYLNKVWPTKNKNENSQEQRSKIWIKLRAWPKFISVGQKVVKSIRQIEHISEL